MLGLLSDSDAAWGFTRLRDSISSSTSEMPMNNQYDFCDQPSEQTTKISTATVGPEATKKSVSSDQYHSGLDSNSDELGDHASLDTIRMDRTPISQEVEKEEEDHDSLFVGTAKPHLLTEHDFRSPEYAADEDSSLEINNHGPNTRLAAAPNWDFGDAIGSLYERHRNRNYEPRQYHQDFGIWHKPDPPHVAVGLDISPKVPLHDPRSTRKRAYSPGNSPAEKRARCERVRQLREAALRHRELFDAGAASFVAEPTGQQPNVCRSAGSSDHQCSSRAIPAMQVPKSADMSTDPNHACAPIDIHPTVEEKNDQIVCTSTLTVPKAGEYLGRDEVGGHDSQALLRSSKTGLMAALMDEDQNSQSAKRRNRSSNRCTEAPMKPWYESKPSDFHNDTRLEESSASDTNSRLSGPRDPLPNLTTRFEKTRNKTATLGLVNPQDIRLHLQRRKGTDWVQINEDLMNLGSKSRSPGTLRKRSNLVAAALRYRGLTNNQKLLDSVAHGIVEACEELNSGMDPTWTKSQLNELAKFADMHQTTSLLSAPEADLATKSSHKGPPQADRPNQIDLAVTKDATSKYPPLNSKASGSLKSDYTVVTALQNAGMSAEQINAGVIRQSPIRATASGHGISPHESDRVVGRDHWQNLEPRPTTGGKTNFAELLVHPLDAATGDSGASEDTARDKALDIDLSMKSLGRPMTGGKRLPRDAYDANLVVPQPTHEPDPELEHEDHVYFVYRVCRREWSNDVYKNPQEVESIDDVDLVECSRTFEDVAQANNMAIQEVFKSYSNQLVDPIQGDRINDMLERRVDDEGMITCTLENQGGMIQTKVVRSLRTVNDKIPPTTKAHWLPKRCWAIKQRMTETTVTFDELFGDTPRHSSNRIEDLVDDCTYMALEIANTDALNHFVKLKHPQPATSNLSAWSMEMLQTQRDLEKSTDLARDSFRGTFTVEEGNTTRVVDVWVQATTLKGPRN